MASLLPWGPGVTCVRTVCSHPSLCLLYRVCCPQEHGSRSFTRPFPRCLLKASRALSLVLGHGLRSCVDQKGQQEQIPWCTIGLSFPVSKTRHFVPNFWRWLLSRSVCGVLSCEHSLSVKPASLPQAPGTGEAGRLGSDGGSGCRLAWPANWPVLSPSVGL